MTEGDFSPHFEKHRASNNALLISVIIAVIKLSVFTVNSTECETMPINEKTQEDVGPSRLKPILPYSSMFIFGQTNP